MSYNHVKVTTRVQPQPQTQPQTQPQPQTHRQDIVNDGRKTMTQVIEHIRLNNPDSLAAYGEFIDNEMDWGRATKAGILLTPAKTVIMGNGKYDINVFPNTFTSRTDNTMTRYDNAEGTERIGKFNAGSTESVYLLGEKATTYHNFAGKLWKTVIDLERVRQDNNISPNSAPADGNEVVDFMSANTALSIHEINTETDRYISWPGQALSYKIGEIKIRELRKKAETQLQTKFDIRAFHEIVLEQGTVTLAILETRINNYIERVLHE